jgi:hypothetical protein
MATRTRRFRELIEADEILVQQAITTGSVRAWCSRWAASPRLLVSPWSAIRLS